MIFIFRCWGGLSRTNTRRCSVSSSVQKRRRCPTPPTQLWTQKNSRLNQSSIFRAPCVCLSTPRVCSRFPSVSCPTSQSQGCWHFRCVSAFVLISLYHHFSSAEAPLVFVCFVSVIYLLAITLEFLFCTARSVLPACSPGCCQNSWLVLMILHHSAIGDWKKINI